MWLTASGERGPVAPAAGGRGWECTLGSDGSGGVETLVGGEQPASPELCREPYPASPKPEEGRQEVETCAVGFHLLFLLFLSPSLSLHACAWGGRRLERGER